MIPKLKRIENPSLLAVVRNQACAAHPCWVKPVDAHHVTTRKAGGGDTKDNVMPLCRQHHTEWHQIGPGKMIKKYYGVWSWLCRHDRKDFIGRLYR